MLDAATLRTALECPPGLGPELQALWMVAQGDWNGAHTVVQDEDGAAAAWVHAHLHRKEGDLSNAAYWYSRARRPVCHSNLEQEWNSIVSALLDPNP